MYRLNDNKEWSEEIKNAFKTSVVRNSLIFSNGIVINEDNYLSESHLEELRYVEDEGFIGQCVAKRVKAVILNPENDLNLENKEFEYVLSTQINDETFSISYGKFIVQGIEVNDTKGTIEIEALDYMSKFNTRYVCGIRQWATPPVTLKDILLDVCDQCNVELGTHTFRNSNFVVEGNTFVNNEQCREVVRSIAKDAFSIARIGQDNKLYIEFEQNNVAVEEYDIDNYINLETNIETKPITSIVLKSSIVEKDENNEGDTLVEGVIIKADGNPCWEGGPVYEDLISRYGENQLVITEDYFAYTEQKRRELILAASMLFGLKYVPLKVSLLGSIYLSSNDVISVINSNGDRLNTYCLNHTIDYKGTLYNNIEVPFKTETAGKYAYDGVDLAIRQTQIIVDKQNQKITAIVQKTDETTDKVSRLDLRVGELESSIKEEMDLTETKETFSGKLEFEDVNESEPIKISIHPTGINISKLYPRYNLYPSTGLFPKTRILKFTPYDNEGHVIEESVIYYELPDDLLYYSDDIYDEFVMQYDNSICYIKKRCGYDRDGNVIVTGGETIVDYEYPAVKLISADYKIEMLGYNTAFMLVQVMKQNIYTTQFATKVELESSFNQTANSIAAEVRRATDTEREIKGTLELKIDKNDRNQVVSMINAVANQVTIDSDHFNLSADGHIVATGGTIAGFTITDNALESATVGISNGHQNAFYINSFDGTNTILFTLDGVMYSRDLYVNGIHILEHLYYPSDEKLKKNIKDTETKALDKISKLKFKQWDWKKDDKHEKFGLIADEVQKVIPNAVLELADGTKVITPNSLVYYNMKAIQELKQENEEMKERIKRLEEIICKK